MAELTRAHCLIRGRVQGVFYRASTRDQAQAAGVTGWVRNLTDGRVEAVFEGNHAAVATMVNWCHGGPRSAFVEDVEVHWEDAEGTMVDFVVRATATP